MTSPFLADIGLTRSQRLKKLLADPEVMAQVEPLLSAAIDARMAPLTAKIDNLAQGVTLLLQAQVEAAQLLAELVELRKAEFPFVSNGIPIEVPG